VSPEGGLPRALDPDDIVETPRLRLEPFDPALVEALRRSTAEAAKVGGFRYPSTWTEADEADFRPDFDNWRWVRLGWIVDDPSLARWLDRIVLDGGRELVARVGFHERPFEGAVECAWWTAEGQRSRGVAAEAVGGLLHWAAGRGVTRAVASIAPGNFSSLRVAAKLGFERRGEAIDVHDGLEWIFERRLTAGA
jgi:RimJ/RimL family protein N-acetyltransferase